MAVAALGSTGAGGIDSALSASYRRFSAAAPRDERADSASSCYVRPLDGLSARAPQPNSSAALLATLIERMGGAVDSRTKGSYVNLRI